MNPVKPLIEVNHYDYDHAQNENVIKVDPEIYLRAKKLISVPRVEDLVTSHYRPRFPDKYAKLYANAVIGLPFLKEEVSDRPKEVENTTGVIQIDMSVIDLKNDPNWFIGYLIRHKSSYEKMVDLVASSYEISKSSEFPEISFAEFLSLAQKITEITRFTMFYDSTNPQSRALNYNSPHAGDREQFDRSYLDRIISGPQEIKHMNDMLSKIKELSYEFVTLSTAKMLKKDYIFSEKDHHFLYLKEKNQDFTKSAFFEAQGFHQANRGRWDQVAERLYHNFKRDNRPDRILKKDELDGLFKSIDQASIEIAGNSQEETKGVKIQHYYAKLKDGNYFTKKFTEMTSDLKDEETAILSAYLKCPCNHCSNGLLLHGDLSMILPDSNYPFEPLESATVSKVEAGYTISENDLRDSFLTHCFIDIKNEEEFYTFVIAQVTELHIPYNDLDDPSFYGDFKLEHILSQLGSYRIIPFKWSFHDYVKSVSWLVKRFEEKQVLETKRINFLSKLRKLRVPKNWKKPELHRTKSFSDLRSLHQYGREIKTDEIVYNFATKYYSAEQNFENLTDSHLKTFSSNDFNLSYTHNNFSLFERESPTEKKLRESALFIQDCFYRCFLSTPKNYPLLIKEEELWKAKEGKAIWTASILKDTCSLQRYFDLGVAYDTLMVTQRELETEKLFEIPFNLMKLLSNREATKARLKGDSNFRLFPKFTSGPCVPLPKLDAKFFITIEDLEKFYKGFENTFQKIKAVEDPKMELCSEMRLKGLKKSLINIVYLYAGVAGVLNEMKDDLFSFVSANDKPEQSRNIGIFLFIHAAAYILRLINVHLWVPKDVDLLYVLNLDPSAMNLFIRIFNRMCKNVFTTYKDQFNLEKPYNAFGRILYSINKGMLFKDRKIKNDVTMNPDEWLANDLIAWNLLRYADVEEFRTAEDDDILAWSTMKKLRDAFIGVNSAEEFNSRPHDNLFEKRPTFMERSREALFSLHRDKEVIVHPNQKYFTYNPNYPYHDERFLGTKNYVDLEGRTFRYVLICLCKFGLCTCKYQIFFTCYCDFFTYKDCNCYPKNISDPDFHLCQCGISSFEECQCGANILVFGLEFEPDGSFQSKPTKDKPWAQLHNRKNLLKFIDSALYKYNYHCKNILDITLSWINGFNWKKSLFLLDMVLDKNSKWEKFIGGWFSKFIFNVNYRFDKFEETDNAEGLNKYGRSLVRHRRFSLGYSNLNGNVCQLFQEMNDTLIKADIYERNNDKRLISLCQEMAGHILLGTGLPYQTVYLITSNIFRLRQLFCIMIFMWCSLEGVDEKGRSEVFENVKPISEYLEDPKDEFPKNHYPWDLKNVFSVFNGPYLMSTFEYCSESEEIYRKTRSEQMRKKISSWDNELIIEYLSWTLSENEVQDRVDLVDDYLHLKTSVDEIKKKIQIWETRRIENEKKIKERKKERELAKTKTKNVGIKSDGIRPTTGLKVKGSDYSKTIKPKEAFKGEKGNVEKIKNNQRLDESKDLHKTVAQNSNLHTKSVSEEQKNATKPATKNNNTHKKKKKEKKGFSISSVFDKPSAKNGNNIRPSSTWSFPEALPSLSAETLEKDKAMEEIGLPEVEEVTAASGKQKESTNEEIPKGEKNKGVKDSKAGKTIPKDNDENPIGTSSSSTVLKKDIQEIPEITKSKNLNSAKGKTKYFKPSTQKFSSKPPKLLVDEKPTNSPIQTTMQDNLNIPIAPKSILKAFKKNEDNVSEHPKDSPNQLDKKSTSGSRCFSPQSSVSQGESAQEVTRQISGKPINEAVPEFSTSFNTLSLNAQAAIARSEILSKVATSEKSSTNGKHPQAVASSVSFRAPGKEKWKSFESRTNINYQEKNSNKENFISPTVMPKADPRKCTINKEWMRPGYHLRKDSYALPKKLDDFFPLKLSIKKPFGNRDTCNFNRVWDVDGFFNGMTIEMIEMGGMEEYGQNYGVSFSNQDEVPRNATGYAFFSSSFGGSEIPDDWLKILDGCLEDGLESEDEDNDMGMSALNEKVVDRAAHCKFGFDTSSIWGSPKQKYQAWPGVSREKKYGFNDSQPEHFVYQRKMMSESYKSANTFVSKPQVYPTLRANEKKAGWSERDRGTVMRAGFKQQSSKTARTEPHYVLGQRVPEVEFVKGMNNFSEAAFKRAVLNQWPPKDSEEFKHGIEEYWKRHHQMTTAFSARAFRRPYTTYEKSHPKPALYIPPNRRQNRNVRRPETSVAVQTEFSRRNGGAMQTNRFRSQFFNQLPSGRRSQQS